MRLPVALTVLALAVAGCSSDTDSPEGPAENPGAPAKQSAGSKGKNTITMKNIEFSPKELTVKVGEPVTWVNEESIEHNAVAKSGEFKSELFGQGGTYKYKPTKPGTIKYVCTVHPGMEGTLKVEAK
ncbi:MAG TPA: plastocyanin/azurin family copper-binding protein [Solirubrobacteraceae bacterium]|jgi:plastocyanin